MTTYILIEETIIETSVRKELCEIIAIEGEVSELDLTALSEGCAMALGVETSKLKKIRHTKTSQLPSQIVLKSCFSFFL